MQSSTLKCYDTIHIIRTFRWLVSNCTLPVCYHRKISPIKIFFAICFLHKSITCSETPNCATKSKEFKKGSRPSKHT